MTVLLSSLVILGFIVIHLYSQKLVSKHLPLRKFLSFAGGVGVAYVFVHLLPEVSKGQRHLVEQFGIDSGIMSYFVYIIALSGFALFYAMEHLVATTWGEDSSDSNRAESRLFWFHIAFFILYNAMIGYLVASDPMEGFQVIFYFLALGLHFITNDWTLRRHHEEAYDTYGRYLLAVGILVGWGIGTFFDHPEIVIVLVEAFVAGAIALNAIKEELPSGRKSSLAGFLSGLAVITFLLVFL